jgi:hypothetical protein
LSQPVALAAPQTTLPAPLVNGPGSSVSPGPVLTTLTPTFKWQSVSGVSGYQLNLYNLTLKAGYSYTFGAAATSFTIPADVLRGGDKYVWNLRVLESGQSGPPSTYLYFQTQSQSTLPTPVVISPGSTQSPGPALTTYTPTFKWNAVSGVDGYQLNLYDITAGHGSSYKLGATATSFTPSTPLTAGHKFIWNLRVLEGSQSGPPSVYLYFQTPPAPVLPNPTVESPGTTTSPGPVLSTSTPTFKWQAVTGAGITGYQLNLYDRTAGHSYSFTLGASATSFTPSSPLPNGHQFVWNLRVLKGTQSGPPSTYLYFQTPPAKTLPAPTVLGPGSTTQPGPLLTTLTPTFKWDPVSLGITGYQLNLYNITTKQFQSFQIGASATSFTLQTALPKGDDFVWNLRVLDNGQSGPPSTYLYFHT